MEIWGVSVLIRVIMGDMDSLERMGDEFVSFLTGKFKRCLVSEFREPGLIIVKIYPKRIDDNPDLFGLRFNLYRVNVNKYQITVINVWKMMSEPNPDSVSDNTMKMINGKCDDLLLKLEKYVTKLLTPKPKPKKKRKGVRK